MDISDTLAPNKLLHYVNDAMNPTHIELIEKNKIITYTKYQGVWEKKKIRPMKKRKKKTLRYEDI